MKFLMVIAVIFVLVACLASQSNALPAPGDATNYVDGVEALIQLEPGLHSRHKRATCDLLSFAGVNDSACAAHCLLLGKRGGYCSSKAVCICRN